MAEWPRGPIVLTTSEANEEKADVYGCSTDWENWADCVEEEAICDDDRAELSTRGDGDCSDTMDAGLSCTSDADCLGFAASASCDGGSCRYKSCEGSGGIACESDDECQGEDRCGDDLEALEECLADAADDPTLADIDPLDFD